MLDEIMQTLNEEYKKCWKHPEHPMRAWALEWEQCKNNRGHGLGDLNKPCEPPSDSEYCSCCDRRF